MEIYAEIDPVELTGYARAAEANLPTQANENILVEAGTFPNNEITDVEFRVRKYLEGLEETASYRAFDTESPISGRQGYSTMIGEIPPISRKSKIGEYTRIRMNSNNVPEEVRVSTERDVLLHVASIRARIRAAQWELARTGKLVLNENGFTEEYNWGRAAGMDVTPAGDAWTTTATAVPFDDELAWTEAYAAENGFMPGLVVMNSYTRSLQLSATKVTQLAPRGLLAPGRVPVGELAGLRDQHGLPPIAICDALKNVGGTKTKVLLDGEILYLPPVGNQAGETLFGVTAEALEIELVGTDAPGLAAVVYKSVDPVALWTNVSAVAIPVAPMINRVMRATVN